MTQGGKECIVIVLPLCKHAGTNYNYTRTLQIEISSTVCVCVCANCPKVVYSRIICLPRASRHPAWWRALLSLFWWTDALRAKLQQVLTQVVPPPDWCLQGSLCGVVADTWNGLCTALCEDVHWIDKSLQVQTVCLIVRLRGLCVWKSSSSSSGSVWKS
jgi:hypothetical protein